MTDVMYDVIYGDLTYKEWDLNLELRCFLSVWLQNNFLNSLHNLTVPSSVQSTSNFNQINMCEVIKGT